MIEESAARRELPKNINFDAEGNLQILNPGDDSQTALLRGIGDTYIEVFSEMTGGAIGHGATWLTKNTLGKIPGVSGVTNAITEKLGEYWMKLHPGKGLQDFTSVLADKGKFFGALNEMGEERLGDILRATFNVDDFGAENPKDIFSRLKASIPSGEQLLTEGAAFGVVGGLGHAASYVGNRTRKSKDLQPIPGVPPAAAELPSDAGPAPTPQLQPIPGVPPAAAELPSDAGQAPALGANTMEILQAVGVNPEMLSQQDPENAQNIIDAANVAYSKKMMFNDYINNTPDEQIDADVAAFRGETSQAPAATAAPMESLVPEAGPAEPIRKSFKLNVAQESQLNKHPELSYVVNEIGTLRPISGQETEFKESVPKWLWGPRDKKGNFTSGRFLDEAAGELINNENIAVMADNLDMNHTDVLLEVLSHYKKTNRKGNDKSLAFILDEEIRTEKDTEAEDIRQEEEAHAKKYEIINPTKLRVGTTFTEDGRKGTIIANTRKDTILEYEDGERRTLPRGQGKIYMDKGSIVQAAASDELPGWVTEGTEEPAPQAKPEEAAPAPVQQPPPAPEQSKSPDAAEAEAPPAREPWQMTKVELKTYANQLAYAAETDKSLEGRRDKALADYELHRTRVSTAMREGKPVPAEVLKDYPDLVSPEQSKSPDAAEATPPSKTGPAQFGSANKLFTQADKDAALDFLMKSLHDITDPNITINGIKVVGFYVEGGARSFADMVKQLAAQVPADLFTRMKPYLAQWYAAVRMDPQVSRETKSGMDSLDALEGQDIDGILAPEQKELELSLPGLDKSTAVNYGKPEGKEESNATDNTKPGNRRRAPRPASDGRLPLPSQVPADTGNQETHPGTQADNVQAAGEGRDLGQDSQRAGGQDDGSIPGSGRDAAVGHSLEDSQGSVQAAGRRGPAKSRRTAQPDGSDRGVNFRITTELDDIHPSVATNIKILELLKTLETENRPATPEEKSLMAQYTGWGALVQSFDRDFDTAYDRYKQKKEGTLPSWAESDLKEATRKKAWPSFLKLRENMTDDEFDEARRSTLNAHYTSKTVIQNGIWNALKHFGFDGGRALETSAGIGNFIGLQPESTPVDWTAIEIDSTTGKILKALYPQAQSFIQGFEKTALPDNYYDTITSNVPFGDYQLADPKYDKYKFNIHDYFFAKALDKLRPGGVMAMVTSKGTMDKVNDKLRVFLTQHGGQFIGAIRLPNIAFKKTAGTEVVADIIYIKKLMPGQTPDNSAWSEIVEHTLRKKPSEYQAQMVKINKYFEDHPEMILGRLTKESTMYGGNEMTVEDTGGPLEDKIAAAVKLLPANIFEAREKTQKQETQPEKIFAPSEMKEGNIIVSDGKVMQKKDGMLEPTEIPASAVPMIHSYIAVRTAVREVLNVQRHSNDDTILAIAQKKLNAAYDSFVKKHGPISKKDNLRYLNVDTDRTLVKAIEVYNKETGKADKMPIFSQRVMSMPEEVTKADSPSDALYLSLGEKGRIDLEYMARLTGRTQDEVSQALLDNKEVFHNPETDQLETNSEYLSGYVKAKLAAAEAAAALNPKYQKNVEELKKVQPVPLKHNQISPRAGSPWIPTDTYKDYLARITDSQPKMWTVIHNDLTGGWSVTNDGSGSYVTTGVHATQKYGTPDYPAHDLLEAIMNGRQITVSGYDSIEKKNVIDRKATERARIKAQELKEDFNNWIYENPERRDRLVQIYNDQFNDMAKRVWDASRYFIKGLAKIWQERLDAPGREYQKNAIYRGIQGGNLLLAHAVGSGKTLEMAAIAMEAKRLGIAKKPIIVVPNHKLEDWARDVQDAFPQANILIGYKDQMAGDKRREFYARIAAGNYDMVIVTHSSFGMFGMSEEYTRNYIQEQINDIEAAVMRARADQGDGARKDNRIIKQLEKRKENLQTRLTRLAADGKKEKVLTFEELGIDYLLLDEAHNFKGLQIVTNRARVPGMTQATSQKAMNMEMKTRYVNSLHGGKRGVVFATGTPISNSISEMYIMQRYMEPEALKRRGVFAFDDWANTFGDVVSEIEMKPSGKGYEAKERFSRYTNMGELLQMFHKFTDVKTSAELKIPRPELNQGKIQVVPIKATPWLKNYINELDGRAADIKTGAIDPRTDNMLKITSDGAKAALDERLIEPGNAENPNGKIAVVTEKVYDIWKNTRKFIGRDGKEYENGTQLVFCDLGVPKGKFTEVEGEIQDSSMFDVYAAIKRNLMDRGIPAKEIAFIHDANNDEQKQALFDKVNNGQVRILIGNTPRMGEGTNVQTRLAGLHHIDVMWKPAEFEQRNGRILRPGNLHKNVDVFVYVTEESFDVYRWQTVQRKAEAIESVMTAQLDQRTLEGDASTSLTAEEIKAIATGNPMIIEKIKLEKDIDRLESEQRSKVSEASDMQYRKQHLHTSIGYAKTRSEVWTRINDRYLKNKPEKFLFVTNDNKALEADQADKYLLANAAKDGKIGTYAGFEVSNRIDIGGDKKDKIRSYLSINLGEGRTFSTRNLLDNWYGEDKDVLTSPSRAIASHFAGISKDIESAKTEGEAYRRELDKVNLEPEPKFEKQDALDKAMKRYDEINEALGLNKSGDDAVTLEKEEEDEKDSSEDKYTVRDHTPESKHQQMKLLSQLRNALPKGSTAELFPGGAKVTFPNGNTFHVQLTEEIQVDRAAFKKGYGREFNPARDMVPAAWLTKANTMQLVTGKYSQDDIGHEVWHGVKDLAEILPAQQKFLDKTLGSEEAEANAYRDWLNGAEGIHAGLKAIFNRILFAMKRFARIFKPNLSWTKEEIFNYVQSGQAFKSNLANLAAPETAPQYSSENIPINKVTDALPESAKQAWEAYKKYAGIEKYNPSLKAMINLSGNSLRHSIFREYTSIKGAVHQVLPQLLENSIHVDSYDPRKPEDKHSIRKMHVLVGAAEVEGKIYRVTMKAKEYLDSKRGIGHYDLDTLEIEKTAGATDAGGETVKSSPIPTAYININDLIEKSSPETGKVDADTQYATRPANEDKYAKMRQFAAKLAAQEPDPVKQQRMKDNPELYYQPQSYDQINSQLAGLTDIQLLEKLDSVQDGIPVDSQDNFSVLAGLELMQRKESRGEDTANVVEKLAKTGTTVGQLLRQFGELKRRDPRLILGILEKQLNKQGRYLTEPQRKILTDKLIASFAARDAVRNAEQVLINSFNETNARQVDALRKEAELKHIDTMKMVRDLTPKSVPDILTTTIQGNLLAPSSQIANIVGNTMYVPLQYSSQSLGASLDMLDSLIRGKSRTVLNPFHGTAAGARGAATGFARATRQMFTGNLDNLVLGEQIRGFAPIRSLVQAFTGENMPVNEAGNIPVMDRAKKLIESVLGAPAEPMLRLLAFGDLPFKEFNLRRSLFEQARIRGLKGEALTRFMELPPLDAVRQAEKEAEVAVFQEDNRAAGIFYNIFTQIKSIPWIGGYANFAARGVLPYIKTPANLAWEGLQFASPEFSLGRSIFFATKGKKREALISLGKAITGQMILLACYQLLKNGLLSGGPDDDDKKRSLEYSTFAPYSLNLSGLRRLLAGEDPAWRETDEIINYNRLGFFGIIASIVANRDKRAKKEMKENYKLYEYMGGSATFFPEIASATLNMAMLKGTNDLLSAISEEKYDAWLRTYFKTVSSVVLPNTLAAINRARMPYMVDPKAETVQQSFINIAKSKLFMYEDLPVRRDLFGRPIKSTPDSANPWIYQLLDISKSSQIPTDPAMRKVYETFARTMDADAIPSVPDRKITWKDNLVRLDDRQYEQYITLIGAERLRLLDNRIGMDESGIPLERLGDIYKKIYDTGYHIGKMKFIRDNIELFRKE